MKFSITFLLGLTVIAAMGAVIGRNVLQYRSDQAEIVSVVSEIEQLSSYLGLEKEDLARELARLPKHNEYLEDSNEWALKQADRLREKYAKVIPQGGDIVSVRQSDTPRGGPYKDYRIFRVWVPESRPVWLRFSVQNYLAERHLNHTSHLSESLTRSPLSQSGPMQLRLTPGEHDIRVLSKKDPKADLSTSLLKLDGQVLLSTSYQSNQSMEFSQIAAWEQEDFGLQKQLPSLLKLRFVSDSVYHAANNNKRKPKPDFLATIWLSDADFHAEGVPEAQEFPRPQESEE